MEGNEPPACEDWDLVFMAREGDEDAFATLIARHQTPIHRFVYRYVGDEETARDLTQEVFVKAWYALGRVRRNAKFTTWLFQIAVNLCRDYAKSKAARQRRLTRSTVCESGDESNEEREFRHPDAPPDQQTQLAETMEVLDEEIRRLPDELREPFILGALERQPHKDIAAVLGISPKAVEVRIYRARKSLAERLQQRGIQFRER